MHDDVDLFRRGIEQPVRLDHLEALVHHGGGVDRDLAPHAPVRMGAGLLGRDAFEIGQRRVAERAAGSGQQEAMDAAGGRPRAKSAAATGKSRCARFRRQQRRAMSRTARMNDQSQALTSTS
jgi:hypothetical protein